MRVRSITILICIGLLLTLCSCTIRSDKKISEDILRSLRAIRFATVLDFELDGGEFSKMFL